MNKDKAIIFGCVFIAMIFMQGLLLVDLSMQNADLRNENVRLEQLLEDQVEWRRQLEIATVPYSIE